MKRLYAALFLLSIAIGLCVTEYICITGYTREYIERIDNIERIYAKGDFKKAAFSARETEKAWEDTVSVIDMLLFHDYVDEIGRNLSQLEAYIVFKDTAELYATCERTKEQLISLRNSELPVAENII